MTYRDYFIDATNEAGKDWLKRQSRDLMTKYYLYISEKPGHITIAKKCPTGYKLAYGRHILRN